MVVRVLLLFDPPRLHERPRENCRVYSVFPRQPLLSQQRKALLQNLRCIDCLSERFSRGLVGIQP